MSDLVKRSEAAQPPEIYRPRPGSGGCAEKRPVKPHRLSFAIRKRKWQIFLITLAVTLPVALYCYLATPTYRSTVRMQIDPEKEVIAGSGESEPSGRNFESYLNTQYEVLRSPAIAERVIERLHPGSDSSSGRTDSALSTNDSQGRAWWSAALRWFHQQHARDSQERALLSGLQIEPVTGSRIIQVSYSTPDPEFAAAVVNTLAEEFVKQRFEKRYEQARAASRRLEQQVHSLQEQVQEAEAELVRYAREHNLTVDVRDRNAIQDRLAQLNEELTRVQGRLFSTRAQYDALKQATPSRFPRGLKTPVIEKLESRFLELERQLTNLLSRFGENWPEVIEARKEVEQARQQLQQEKEATIAHALQQSRLEYEAGQAEHQMLSSALARQQDLANRLNIAAIQYNILQGDARIKKELYEDMLRRLEETRMVAGLWFENIHIVDPGHVPPFPYRPRTALNVSIALVSGLLLGFGWAFLRERMDRTIKGPDELEQRIGLPALAAIPQFKEAKLKKRTKQPRQLPITLKLTARGPDENRQPVARPPESQWKLWEAYRTLCTAILLSSPDQPPRTILVTSSVPQEGKTTTVSHMGLVLAQTGRSTVLVDLDMRKPALARQFGVNDQYSGISVYLSGNSDSVVDIEKTAFPNLFVLPTGPKPPNPADLMASERMGLLLENLCKRFKHILIDCPPILTVTDAQVLASRVDGVVLVVRAGETPEEIVRRASSQIRRVGGRLLGAAINRADFRGPEYTYYEKYCCDETYFP